MLRKEFVDHINGNTLDNRRENLRLSNGAQNVQNRGKDRDNTSGYKGVVKYGKRWLSQIGAFGEVIKVGVFDTPEEAARAYNEAAIKYHGEYARLNVLTPVLEEK